MNQTNFLIGRGELLTHEIKGPKRNPASAEVYTLEQTQQRLSRQVSDTVSFLDTLPQDACPHDFAVARFVLNPSYIARSYFPTNLFRAIGLQSVGSRQVTILPEKWKRKGQPQDCSTTEIFVAGKRKAFRSLGDWMFQVDSDSDEALDLRRVEEIGAFEPSERILDRGRENDRYYEVGVHLLADEDSSFITGEFSKFAEKLGAKVHEGLSFQAGTLWFVPVEGSQDQVLGLSKFVFVRVIRPVPKLRGLLPHVRRNGPIIECDLPSQDPLSSEPRVAILDGGLPDSNPIGRWVRNYHVMDSSALDDVEGPDHGLAATSAFLFGAIQPEEIAPRPYSYVDHVRVLDNGFNDEDPLLLYRTLGHIEEVLLSRQYEFINLSLGPDIPIEDTEVHTWTSVIDDLLSDGDTFMTVAVGNNGSRDDVLRYDRVQVPSDSVNAIAVGAATNTGKNWKRASYSARGPGRSPGFIKPDLMAFGGSSREYFHVLVAAPRPELVPIQGTSFAAPSILRSAVGIRAVLGSGLSPLAIKALLIHAADDNDQETVDVGWGKVPEDLMEIISCPDGVARIVYQGELKPGKYLRAALPLPDGGLTGNVTVKATFTFACNTDPQDSASYTRAGLEITFRPNEKKLKDGKANANSKSFFRRKKFAAEAELRSDMGKWETSLHDTVRMRGSSLDKPVFDIHYNARESGGAASSAQKIKYALIITVEAPKHPDVYSDILKSYSKLLTPIQPQVSVPIRV
ncbi:S8 family peptidase [Oceanobacter mangrovi]|uniref:S8 family peptidase n=1 Tax=Oceanobacter mangrovi TaxID=2862510 RepID=UPI001C8D5060|nr:S8 family peptidase [Oceanobacter mangrovi]